jgi:hypothetical protein
MAAVPQRRATLLIVTTASVIVAAAVWWALAGASDQQPSDTGSAAATAGKPSPSPMASEPPMQAEGGLSGRELTFARDIARYEIARAGAKVTSVTVTASAGKEPSHNVGDACMYGRLLHIRVIGDFPHIAVSGKLHFSGSGEAESIDGTTVRSMEITADAKTGRACLLGVGTRAVAPEAGAISLPID